MRVERRRDSFRVEAGVDDVGHNIAPMPERSHAAFGPAVGAVVAVLLATPFDSGSTLAGMLVKALPALALGVAAGVATIYAAKLLAFAGRKVRPWFRRPATKPGKGSAGASTPAPKNHTVRVPQPAKRLDELFGSLHR